VDPTSPQIPADGAWASTEPNPLEQLTLRQLQHRTSMKWRAHPPDVLPLWVAEMDVPLADPVARELRRAVDLGDTGYPRGSVYAEAFTGFAARRWGWDVSATATAIVPDVMLGIVEVLRLVTERGDTVVVNPPVYPPFYAFVAHDGRRVVEAPLGGRGRVDLQRLEEAFTRARRSSPRVAYLLCNPHNPTGVVHTREELAAIAALAQRHAVRVVADEIHAPLVLPGTTFTPYLTVEGAEDAFAVFSASKAFNLAGLKAALAVAGPQARSDLRRMPEEVSHGPSHLGVIAHAAALAEGDRWLDALLTGLDANRARLGRLLAEHLPQVRYRPPEATYLAWLDCRDLGLENSDDHAAGPGVVTDLAGTARFFLDHARVALTSGHVFGTGGAGFVRLNFATSVAMLTRAVTAMGAATAQLSPASPAAAAARPDER
jgi:cystathionine beta-lyase